VRGEILGHAVGSRPVMCAIDDGEASRQAVRVAGWLARALDTRLVLAHAFDPMGVAAHTRKRMLARGLTDDHLVRVERRAARLLLDAAAQNVTGPSAEAGGGVKMECVSTGRVCRACC
jgi:universal stress protein family protein